MNKYAGQPNYSLSDQASILWWRTVILVTRRLDRFLGRALPIVTPLKPLLWIPITAVMFGFVFGLSAVFLLA